jgi:7-cyano-7-deazaguanine reductase
VRRAVAVVAVIPLATIATRVRGPGNSVDAVVGTFTHHGGKITTLDSGTNCTNQKYLVADTLKAVSTLTSDELAAICPVTGQPDLYVATIEYQPEALCLESKSLKLYLVGFRDGPHFCEAPAVRIRDDVAEALELSADMVKVTLRQKARGGISITATS